MAGAQLGYPIAGLLGGLFSSTAATLHLSRQSRREPQLARPLAVGVLGACAVLLPRVVIVAAILNPAVAVALIPTLLPSAVVAVVIVAWTFLQPRGSGTEGAPYEDRSPLRLGTAIPMALGLQAIIFVIAFVRQTWGSPGVLASAAVLGLTDVDALTLSMSTMGSGSDVVALGAQAIAVGILANTILKLTLVLALGNAGFRRWAAGGLVALAAGTALGLWLRR
jgi:uncharacterized membrane protein (DUF4010 family)